MRRVPKQTGEVRMGSRGKRAMKGVWMGWSIRRERGVWGGGRVPRKKAVRECDREKGRWGNVKGKGGMDKGLRGVWKEEDGMRARGCKEEVEV
jgi:hypothetical protein